MAPPLQYPAQNERQPFNMSSHSSQATRTSRSPSFFNGMDRAMPPVKMSSQIYEPYLSISPSGSSGREQYPAFSSTAEFPTRQIMVVQDSSHLHQPENPLARFMHEDSSWDPLGGRQNGLPLNLGSFPEYTVYRNTAAPSEVDTIGPATITSDSAYGSMPRQSVGQPSVYGDMDHCAETQSLIQGVSDFQFHPGLSPDAIPSRGDQSDNKSWDQHGASANSEANSLVCPHCHAQVKTKSELKKHEQRHSKPHRCNIENCPRNGDGFSTLNDLARHKQTVHKIGGLKYRCHMGQCANKKKDWPRADNFKQHLQRVHNFQTNDLEEFKATSSEPAQQSYPDLAETTPPQLPVHVVPVSHWGQTLTVTAPMNPPAEPVPRQLVTNSQLSDGSPSIDGSSLGDIDESQYTDQIPFDGMGLDGKMGQILPELEPTRPTIPEGGGSSDQTIDPAPSYINPDILNHIGLRTTFPGDQAGPKNIPSQILELEPEGPTTFDQDERETDFRADQHAFSRSPRRVITDYDQDSASEQEDSNGSELTGASDRAEHSPSPRAESGTDSPRKAESEALKLNAHTAASSPESMNLDETDASDLVEHLMKKQVLDKLLQQFGYRMVKESDIKDQTKETASSEPQANMSGGRHACGQCNKSFSRACELRKHRKRHDKPYACTYAQCEKRFGSKNDWKRHENSQHFQLECWKCNEKSKESDEMCGKVCHRRETFTNHLEKDHSLDQETIEGKWATCRVGRNCETRFWCGFCKTVVELVGGNGLAWTERFNHIDEHFNGRNGKPKADISEWKNVEPEPSESLEFLQPLKPQAKRGRPLSTELSKKRGRSRSTDESSRVRRKKFRAEDGEVFWSCCECSTEWNLATMGTRCLACRHDQCSECPMEAHKLTEDVATVS